MPKHLLGAVMTSRADSFVLAADEAILGDSELVLLGVLARSHVLGGGIQSQPASPEMGTGIDLDPADIEAALASRRLTVVDEEQTPVASLTEVHRVDGEPPTRLRGTLVPERARESGWGGAQRLSLADADEGFDRIVILARPVTTQDQPIRTQPGERVLLLIPDLGAATDHIPPPILVALGARLTAELQAQGATVILRYAPLRWRDAESDAALIGLLAERTGAGAALALSPNIDVDPHAATWRSAREALNRAVDERPIEGLDAATVDILRRWRAPRPRRGLTLMFTGFSGSGKSTLARAVRLALETQTQRTVSILDGDVVRRLLSSGLGFDRASRILNVRRIGFVAAEVTRHGGVAICAPIAPYAHTRAEVRTMVEAVGDFILIHVSTSLQECERRDLKGLYAAARAGRIPEFTGISDPYDVPTDADLSIDTEQVSVEDGVRQVLDFLANGGWISRIAVGTE